MPCDMEEKLLQTGEKLIQDPQLYKRLPQITPRNLFSSFSRESPGITYIISYLSSTVYQACLGKPKVIFTTRPFTLTLTLTRP